jgi:hypothetical protein
MESLIKHFSDESAHCSQKVIYSALPIAPAALLSLPPGCAYIFVFGGAAGARGLPASLLAAIAADVFSLAREALYPYFLQAGGFPGLPPNFPHVQHQFGRAALTHPRAMAMLFHNTPRSAAPRRQALCCFAFRQQE